MNSSLDNEKEVVLCIIHALYERCAGGDIQANGGGAVAYRPSVSWARGVVVRICTVYMYLRVAKSKAACSADKIFYRSRVCGVTRRWPSIMARSERLLPRARTWYNTSIVTFVARARAFPTRYITWYPAAFLYTFRSILGIHNIPILHRLHCTMPQPSSGG